MKLKCKLISFTHKYPNDVEIEISKTGFTLWDRECSRWIIDASLMTEDDTIRIAKECIQSKKKQVNPRSWLQVNTAFKGKK